MSRRRSLLEQVRGLLERTYRMQSGLGDLAPFLIGDRGYRLLYSGEVQHRRIGSPNGARLLVREADGVLHARVYFPDALIRQLERHPPSRGVGDANVDAFATLVEETDHLLVLAERARQGRPVTLFEMELHANVSKYLVLSRFLAGRETRLAPERRAWLWRRLFDGVEYAEEESEVQQRYEDAAMWAVRLIQSLADRRTDERLEMLRQFHSAGTAEKVDLIRGFRA